MKLNYRSKNIVIFLLLMLVGVSLDMATNSFLFSTPALAMAGGLVPWNDMKKTAVCNMAGIATTLYVIDVNDVESMPNIAAPSTPEALVTYIDDFVLKTNKFWSVLYSTKEMGELLGEIDGPTDGKFFRNKVSAFHPRINGNSLGMTTIWKDSDVIVIIKQFSGNGLMRVVGHKDLAATCFGSENSGKAFSDEQGITYEIEGQSCNPAMIYTGEVVTSETVLYTPTRLAVDATTLDANLSNRFVVGANTSAIILATISNMQEGQIIRIEFDALSTNSLAFTGAFASTALIDAIGEWFEITNQGTLASPVYVITNGVFA